MADHVCPWWGGYFIDNGLRRLLHNPRTILSPHVQPGMTVMDFGCGMGIFALEMARLVEASGSVIAVDLQRRMLDTLEKRARKAGVVDRIQTHRCEANSLGIRASLDFALAFYSVHEVPDARRLLGEIADCLRADHHLLVVEPIGHVPKQRFEAMIEQAADAGLQLVDRPHVRLSHTALLAKTPR